MTDPHLSSPDALPTTFDELKLSEPTMRAIRDIGYSAPTPVQAGAVPIALTGRDVMVQSQTGTGKTAAFSLPLIEQICARTERSGVQAIILAPTRELARQVAQEMNTLSTHHQLEVCTIYGGTPFDPQVTQLKTADVVVGTPGRVVDHLKRRTLSLSAVRHFVLDEADEMLSMGFAEELEQVRKRLPKERQTLFFSATFPPAVKRYSERTLVDPELLSFLDESSSADDLDHAYYMVRGLARSTPLTKILMAEEPKNAIIFVNTRRDCELVMKALKRAGLDADRLSGDMDQKERERVMAKMKRKSLRFLVATDVAARGIDITQLSHVIHYQLPDSPEVYIHRSGRTGRAGEKGTVLSLVGPQEIGVLYALKRFHHLKLIEREVPKVSAPRKALKSSSSVTPTPEPKKAEAKLESKRPEAKLEGKRPEAKRPEAKRPEARELEPPVSRAPVADPLIRSLLQGPSQVSPQLRRAARSILEHERALDLVCALISRQEGANLGAAAEAPPPASPRPPASAAPSGRPQEERSAPRRSTPFEALSVNIGRDDVRHVQALKDLIAELGGLLPEDISSVQMKRRSSQIEVSSEFSTDLIEALNGEPYGERMIKVKRVTT